ncbi:MAG TPA: tetratricopeptide repeat protein [Gemmatimonadaceae bacterium]|jgi:tetratricopeptide (TPR) repeat protein
MSDDIRRLSEELARDPSSVVFLQLGEALRRGGQLDLALRVSMRGAERHPQMPDAHDLLARIRVDLGDLADATLEWEAVLRLAPEHVGARKGLGYVLYKQGRLEEAERHLGVAAANGDTAVDTALRMVRRLLRYTNIANGTNGTNGETHTNGAWLEAAQRRVEDESHYLFADILGDGQQTALLLDGEGLVTAGAYVAADGEDVAQEVGAAVMGVRDEADRTVKHLDLGTWRAVIWETDVATVALGPVLHDSLALVAAAQTVPLGLVRRVLDRCVQRAESWMREVA